MHGAGDGGVQCGDDDVTRVTRMTSILLLQCGCLDMARGGGEAGILTSTYGHNLMENCDWQILTDGDRQEEGAEESEVHVSNSGWVGDQGSVASWRQKMKTDFSWTNLAI